MPTIRLPAFAAGAGAATRASAAPAAGALLLGGVCALIIGGAFMAGEAARGAQTPSSPQTAAEFSLRGLIAPDRLDARTLRGALADARDLECLTQAVYYEARGEPETGQAAVAQVVLNRTRAGRYPRSVCGVVFQHVRRACQFSFACDGAVRRPRERAAWTRSEQVAQRALAGERRAGIGEATQFRVAGLSSYGLVRVAQIGAHVFYDLAHGVHARPRLIRTTIELAAPPTSAAAAAAAPPVPEARASTTAAAASTATPAA